MIETLYKTKSPEVGKSEYYEIALKMLPVSGPRRHYFREDHGWWDDGAKKFILNVTPINTAEEGVLYKEAEAMYMSARANLIRNGFIYSFAPQFGDEPFEYQV